MIPTRPCTCHAPKFRSEPDGRIWCISCGLEYDIVQAAKDTALPNEVTSKVPPRSAGELRDAYNLITQQELAFMLNVTEPTLRVWRHEGRGPDYVKFGKQVFYTRDAIERWMNSSTVQLVPRTSK